MSSSVARSRACCCLGAFSLAPLSCHWRPRLYPDVRNGDVGRIRPPPRLVAPDPVYPKSLEAITDGRRLAYALRTPHRAGEASFRTCLYAGLFARACCSASAKESPTDLIGGGETRLESCASARAEIATASTRTDQRIMREPLLVKRDGPYACLVAEVSACDEARLLSSSLTGCEEG